LLIVKKIPFGSKGLNAFTSTSKDRAVAILFANTEETNDKYRSVLLQFDFDTSNSSNDLPPCVDISQISIIPGEGEFLFLPGTIVQIQDYSIDDEYPQIHIFRLKIVEKKAYEDPFLDKLRNDLLNNMHQSDSEVSFILSLFPILGVLGKRDQIIQLINNIPQTSNPLFESLRLVANFCNNTEISLNSNHLHQLSSRYKQLHHQLSTDYPEIRQLIPGFGTFLTSWINYLDSISQNPEDVCMDDVFDKYTELSKQLIGSVSRPTSADPSDSYFSNMENTLVSQISLGRDQTTWNGLDPLTHQSLVDNDNFRCQQRLLADADKYTRLGLHEDAIQCCEEAFSCARTDEDCAYILVYLANLYEKQKRWSQVILCGERLLRLSQLPENSLHIVHILRLIANACYYLKWYHKALQYYQYAFSYLHEQHSSNHLDLRKALINRIKAVKCIILAQIFQIPIPDFGNDEN